MQVYREGEPRTCIDCGAAETRARPFAGNYVLCLQCHAKRERKSRRGALLSMAANRCVQIVLLAVAAMAAWAGADFQGIAITIGCGAVSGMLVAAAVRFGIIAAWFRYRIIAA